MTAIYSWVRDKARINHDVLKNQVLQSVSYLLRVLEGRVEDVSYLRVFLRREVPRWAVVRLELNELIDRFEFQMSPARLFDESPLNLVPEHDREWMSETVHRLWWEEEDMQGQYEACRHSIARCDVKWADLVRELERLMHSMSTCTELQKNNQIITILSCGKLLHNSNHELSLALSRLPSTVGTSARSM